MIGSHRGASGGVAPSPLVSFSAPSAAPEIARTYVACDRCGFGAWLGSRGQEVDAWCEACQEPAVLAAPVGAAAACAHCGESLSTSTPRFEELFGELQNLTAVLEAWLGRDERLQPLIPERPTFLTDLNPPPLLPWDPPDLRLALEHLIAGAFHAAREAFARVDVPGSGAAELRLRVAMGQGIVHHRLGEWDLALAAFDRAVVADPWHLPARLDRGALRAMRGEHDRAWDDFEAAGDSYQAGWNRAAWIVLQASSDSAPLPPAGRIRAAREQAGPPSGFWSDPTVGRLVFTTVAERLRSRGGENVVGALRAAEAEVEFETFTDRAMVLRGWVSLGIESERARVASPLARGVIRALRATPFVRGGMGRELSDALEQAAAAVSRGEPQCALEWTKPHMERSDLRHYRVPCRRCETGSIGVERVVEADQDPELE